MIRIDHISLVVQNIFEAADRLRAATGLGYYDAGWTTAGLASRVFPLGGCCYLQMEGVVDAHALADPKNTALKTIYDQAAAGDRFRGFALGVDSMAELEANAKRHGVTTTFNPTVGRMLPDGRRLVAAGMGNVADAWSNGVPIWNFFPDMTTHPSGQPVVPYPHLRKPLGLAWLEVGGDAATMTGWIGQPAESLKIRFNGKAPGLYKVAVQTATTEIVIERRAIHEA